MYFHVKVLVDVALDKENEEHIKSLAEDEIAKRLDEMKNDLRVLIRQEFDCKDDDIKVADVYLSR